METIRDIRRRINSITMTMHITRAMKLVATAKLKAAQDRLLAARPFAQRLAEVMNELATLNPGAHPLLAKRPRRRLGLLVFTADRGLCGSFNERLVAMALAYREQAGAQTDVIAIGEEGRRLLARQGVQVMASYPGLISQPHFQGARRLAREAMRRYEAGEWDEVSLVYAKFYSTLEQRPRVFELLPLEPEKATKPREVMRRGMVLFEPEPGEILSHLFERYVETELYRAILETHAGEFGARMTAMTAATDNAQEILERLTLQLNSARQGAITKELAEIVGGAEALASRGEENNYAARGRRADDFGESDADYRPCN